MGAVRYVITRYRNGILSFTYDIQTNKMVSVAFMRSDTISEMIHIGDIFVAKVINVVQQLNAVFIHYAPNKKGYLPINHDYEPVMVNRKYDGRILAGDEILVQLEKEAVRTKEPVFTTNLSLAGKYSVVSNANTYKGVSRKCSRAEREQLLSAIPPDIDYGVVIRTNAALLLYLSEGTQSELQTVTDEIMHLKNKMSTLLQEGIHRTCYSRIWQSPPAYLTNMRDEGIHYQQIITDDETIYHESADFVTMYMPEQQHNMMLYQDIHYPLQKLYRVETQLNELLSKKVWLDSGAYLVIEKTEAMYVIDVNSGKNVTKKDNAAYIYQINLEAADEIMRQIRLRNLTGIILIDFINMEDTQKSDMLLQALRSLAKKDRILTTVVDMTTLGLVEITRKKTTKSLSEQLGDGVIKT
ncbi:MAG: ribonuclease E/G [Lachnospiraceae bacterium]|nr:ribonuclease E/G [Lachnospiraceae bacterium]